MLRLRVGDRPSRLILEYPGLENSRVKWERGLHRCDIRPEIVSAMCACKGPAGTNGRDRSRNTKSEREVLAQPQAVGPPGCRRYDVAGC